MTVFKFMLRVGILIMLPFAFLFIAFNLAKEIVEEQIDNNILRG